ncbi:MAG: indolepyruvate oxidoreductase subunit beta [Armatimonadota bacterium]|nr:indolepyruvate oxidoreductase subunit beta [Armatimonadota bacterium]
MDAVNFLFTGVGGQGTVLAGDITAAVGLAAGYDVKKSDILGLAVRGGAVVGHVRWGRQVHSPIVPEGCVDFMLAFELLEGLRWLHQVREGGTVLINEQEIHPVTVSSGHAMYPTGDAVEQVLRASPCRVHRIPALKMAQTLGNTRTLNVVLLGALSTLLPVAREIWEQVLGERIPVRYRDLNLRAFHEGRAHLGRDLTPCGSS